jgi:large subunit ribosomal protein L24
MKIKKGDNVIMLRGKDNGKKGKISHVFTKEDKVIVEGLNMIKKHVRAKKQGQKGQIITVERRVPASSVQLVCPKCGKKTRVGYIVRDTGKSRICRKCEVEI